MMKVVARLPQMVLGFALAYAGIGHLTSNRQEFQAQVPTLLKITQTLWCWHLGWLRLHWVLG